MKELSSPTQIVKQSIDIFFEKTNLIFFLKIGLVGVLINVIHMIPSYINNYGNGLTSDHFKYLNQNPNMFILTTITFVVVSILSLWSQSANYEAIKRINDKNNLDFIETFKSSWQYILKFFLVSLLTGLAIAVGFILLIIPGILLSVWYAFALFPIVEGKEVFESIKISKELVQGRFWKVLYRLAAFTGLLFVVVILFSMAPYNIGTFLSSLIAGIYLLPYYLLYKELQK